MNLYRLFIWPFAIYHILIFGTFIGRPETLWGLSGNFEYEFLTYIKIIFVIALLIKKNPIFLFLAALTALLESYAYFPSTSNSLIMSFVLNLIIVAGYLVSVVQSKNFLIKTEIFYKNFAPAGRFLLLTMYFFGTFHKINSGFLDPDTSYAVVLLKYFKFLPVEFIQNTFVQYSAIYGTFIIEAGIILLLLLPKYRYFGVLIGILFHMLLSLNYFSVYQHFTCLSIALHFLFLSPNCLTRFEEIRAKMKISKMALYGVFWLYMTGITLATIYYIRADGSLTESRFLWLPIGLLISLFVIACDFKQTNLEAGHNYYLSKSWAVNIIAFLFFVSCFSPFIGLKNEQVLSMFSNLRTGDGYSNHLIIRQPYYLFDNLTHPVNVLATTHPDLKKHKGKKAGRSPFIIEYQMARRPEEGILYKQEGIIYDYSGGISPELQQQWKKPTFLYKMLSFRPIPTKDMRGF